MWPRATGPTESAITFRLTRDVFMPSVPVVIPSSMATVSTSMGYPPQRLEKEPQSIHRGINFLTATGNTTVFSLFSQRQTAPREKAAAP